MSCSLQSFWRANLLFCLGLFLHSGEARILTEAQPGPLYRVAGSPLFISCNVSGFANANARKEFEFRVKKPARPTFDINIISSSDENFGYSVYASRVKNGEVTLTHVSPNSVLFKIQSLLKSDEGEFDCAVINSESVYDGTYSALTTVKVIDDSLSVSSPASTSLSYDEGDALTLTCQASSNTVQHTHLSLAWYLHRDGEENAQPIISLDRDFTLSPGQGFEGRYQAGLIRLDKVGEATYKLKMAQLQLSDQGRIYCQAQEWIQDPDRSWYSIAQKSAVESTLSVKAREVVSDTSSLVVKIAAQPTTLQEGHELSLSCSVDTQNLEERFFSVAWVKGGVELARIGPTGILSVGPEYSVRARQGELRAARAGTRDYRLTLQPVRTEDQGEYFCRAWPQDRGQDGVFTQGAEQNSNSQLVTISATESGLSLEMQNSVSVNEGDGLKLTCKVHGVTGQLSVTWQHKAASTSAAVFTTVVSLTQEGVMERAEEFVSRKVKATRPAADTFTLELDEVTPSDSGVYQCAVSEWKINSKTSSQSQTTTVTVVPADLFMKVNLISRNNIATVGENVELMCRVRGPRVPITLTWSLQRDASTIDNILTLYSDGTISWSGDQHHYQLKVQNRQKEVIHYLLINGASQREAGSYRCSVSVFLENVHKKLPPSNQLAVKVENPKSKLRLTSTPALTSNINTDIEIKCSVISEPSPSSRYAVTWLLQQQAENKTILSSDRDALITFGPQVDLSHRQRISMRRTKGPSFELSVRQAQILDKGLYTCEVVEWLQDPRGDWYQLPPVSRTTNITVNEPAHDLRLDKTEQSLTAMEGDEVEIKCNIISGAPSPSFFYKVTWLYTGHDSSIMNTLVELDHTGLLSYSKNQGLRGLQERLRLSRPTQSSFYLGIQKTHVGDSGTYQCQVEQYQLNHEGHWQQKASESAGAIMLTVNVPVSKLDVTPTPALTSNINTDIEIKCSVTSEASASSRYAVTWLLQKQAENKTVVISDRDALITFGPQVEVSDRQRISMRRTKGPSFELSIRQARISDKGSYICEVVEWLQDPRGDWYQLSSVSRTIELTLIEPANDLRLNKTKQSLTAMEGDEVELKCKIISGGPSPSFFYKVTWLYTGHSSHVMNTLVALDHTGLLSYPENQGLTDLQKRLRLSRPTQNSFHLGIQRVHGGDNGTYRCQVEQYQLDHDGHWQQKASEDAGPTMLTVNVPDKNLAIVTEEGVFNVSTSQGFTISCNITKQCSSDSEFQVVWFWQKDAETEPLPIFTAYRNSTLQGRFGKGDQLRFSHPLPDQFSLTVMKPGPEDSGLYFCEVEEWLPSLSHGWRKVAVEKSGYLTVNVYAEGEVKAESECKSGPWIGILVVLVIVCILLVAFILVQKMHRNKGGKKSDQSLWAEQHPLNTKPSAED